MPYKLPTAVGKIAATGKGVWDVTTTAGKATVTLAKTAQIMSSGFIPFNAQFTKNVLLNQAQITGLLHTATSQHIISGVRQIQTSVINMKTAVVNTAKGIQTGVVTATNAVKRSYTLVRGVVNGSVMSSVVAHQVLQKRVLLQNNRIERLETCRAGRSPWSSKRGSVDVQARLTKRGKRNRRLVNGCCRGVDFL